jgi:hypothetical protein
MASDQKRLGWWVAAVLAAVGVMAFHLVWGDLNQDEGWYLYAAQRTWEGAWPYRDYAFTQGPLWPLLYSWLTPLVRWGGVLAGRVATACLGLMTAGLAARLAGRLTPDPQARPTAVFAAFCLAAIHPVQAYYMSVVKTYALSGLFLTAGLLLFPRVDDDRRALRAFASLWLLTAAAAVRGSAAVAVGIALAVLIAGDRNDRESLLGGLLGSAVGMVVFLLPFYLGSPEGFRFGLVEYHAGRTAGGWLSSLLLKAGFVSLVAQAFYAVGVLSGLAWWVRRATMGAPAKGERRWTLVGLTLAGMTLIHLAAPFPYDDYQVPVYPLAAAGAAALAASLPSWRPFLGPALLGAMGLAALASPLNQKWMVRERDRIWWRMKDRPPLFRLREAAAEIERLDPGGTTLLTQDLYLAVESRRRVPAGLELGPFSIFPGLSEDEAAARRVMTLDRLEALLREGPCPLAAFSGYGLAIRAPEIVELRPEERERLWTALQSRYRPVGEIPFFGQAGTTLTLWRREEAEERPQAGRRLGD